MISTTPEILDAVHDNDPFAIGVSGGKDSCAAAIATNEFLDRSGHCGPRVLIHSDLGVTEWRESLPVCQRLSKVLGLELLVVRRKQGDMMDRWEQRWRDNVRRYESLSCVKLILPWSTASMRFCTSELKTDVICRELSLRFPGRRIVSVIGIRRDESAGRAKRPVTSQQKKLTKRSRGTSGLNWHPIIEWSTQQVYEFLSDRGFSLHEAYTKYGMPRVSCVFCILATQECHRRALSALKNVGIYRRMVGLEVRSSFAFQDDKWLADIAPDLHSDVTRTQIATAKQVAVARQEIESHIPKHLLYTKGWPTCKPSKAEADLLARVRIAVSDLLGLHSQCLDSRSVRARYQELMDQKRSTIVSIKRQPTNDPLRAE